MTLPSIYRAYDETGRLLYVGATSNLARRIKQHERGTPWWGDVADVDQEGYSTMSEALVAEADAINAESPLHNIAKHVMGVRESWVASPFDLELSGNIRAEAGRRRVARAELASIVSLSIPALARRINGAHPWSAREVAAIAIAFDIDMARLIPSPTEAGLEVAS
jgi:predicted GIY-YIG superfamily endonuclease